MNKYTTEQLIEAIIKHKNVSAHIALNNIMRIINGDLMFLQDAIMNGDTILCVKGDSEHLFNGEPECYTVKPDYETITHLGVEIPAPLSEYPEHDTVYYCRSSGGNIAISFWADDETDKGRFKYGIWLSKKHARIAIERINQALEIKHDR